MVYSEPSQGHHARLLPEPTGVLPLSVPLPLGGDGAQFLRRQQILLPAHRLLGLDQIGQRDHGLVEWLDVQLTKRDEQHRIALHEVEQQLAERDRHIRELEQLHRQRWNQVEDNEALPTDKAA